MSAAPWWWVQHGRSSPVSKILRFIFLEAGNLWEEPSRKALVFATLAGFYLCVGQFPQTLWNPIVRIVPALVFLLRFAAGVDVLLFDQVIKT